MGTVQAVTDTCCARGFICKEIDVIPQKIHKVAEEKVEGNRLKIGNCVSSWG